MFRTIATALGALWLGLLLAGGAFAQQDNDDGVASGPTCADELLQCVYDCTWYESDEQFAICNQECNEDFGICSRAEDETAGLERPPSSKGPKLGSNHVKQLGALSATELEQACSRAGGIFSAVQNQTSCIKLNCAATGNCTIACTGGSCLAITPVVLEGQLTLIGILQNGNNVSRGDSSSGGSLAPGGSAPPGCSFNCG